MAKTMHNIFVTTSSNVAQHENKRKAARKQENKSHT